MQFSAILALVASIGFVVATPAPAEPAAAKGEAVLSTDAGCNSFGPLGNSSAIWFILRNAGGHPCTRTCQAMDHTGCIPGDETHIAVLEVDDPNDTFNVARATHQNTLPFICPSGGEVRCQAQIDSSVNSPQYSIRTFANVD